MRLTRKKEKEVLHETNKVEATVDAVRKQADTRQSLHGRDADVLPLLMHPSSFPYSN